jgi:glutaryl-CoA dehydrogenase
MVTNDQGMLEFVLVEPSKLEGVKIEQIQNINFLRCLPHYRLTFEATILPESCRSLKQTEPSTAILKLTELAILHSLWIAAGICMGSYEAAVKYATVRQQFGRSIAAFQLIQDKIVRMMANTQAILLLCLRTATNYHQGKARLEHLSTSKAFVMERAREVVRLGR